MQDKSPFEREVSLGIAAAREAGKAILDVYAHHTVDVKRKPDGSAVTDADLASDRIIRDYLGYSFPDDPLLTEEGIDHPGRVASRRCWIVDPIDGTNQFINRTGEFEVLIALVVDGRPAVAVVYQPTADVLISAVAGHGASISINGDVAPLAFTPLRDDQAPRILTSTWLGAPENVQLISTISHALGGGDAIVSDIGVTVRRFIPPNSMCDALVGLHINDGATYAWEWDFAAPDLVVHEAGGLASDLQGKLLQYNKPNPVNVGGLVMSVDPATHARLISVLALRLDSSSLSQG